MLFNRLAKSIRLLVTDAVEIARDLGCSTVEGEHLLLAVTRADAPAARALAEHGLGWDELHTALERETERSLAAVGVAAEAGPFSPWVEPPRFGTSAKSALERALRTAAARGDRELAPAHLALGVLGAQRGTVPRAVEIAGADVAELSAALRATLR